MIHVRYKSYEFGTFGEHVVFSRSGLMRVTERIFFHLHQWVDWNPYRRGPAKSCAEEVVCNELSVSVSQKVHGLSCLFNNAKDTTVISYFLATVRFDFQFRIQKMTMHTVASAGSISGTYRIDSIHIDSDQAPAEGEASIELVSSTLSSTPPVISKVRFCRETRTRCKAQLCL